VGVGGERRRRAGTRHHFDGGDPWRTYRRRKLAVEVRLFAVALAAMAVLLGAFYAFLVR
jgi:hypothetical protein